MEKVTIHFHSGTCAVATITEEDINSENDRLGDVQNFDGPPVECAEELCETALTVPPRPRWLWIGDVFAFSQAVAGIEFGNTVAG